MDTDKSVVTARGKELYRLGGGGQREEGNGDICNVSTIKIKNKMFESSDYRVP